MILIKDKSGKTIAIVKESDLPLSIEKDGVVFYVKKATKKEGFYGNNQK